MNQKLYLPTGVVCNLNISDSGIFAATVLSCYARDSNSIEIVSLRPTIELLCGGQERRMVDRLREGINELAENKYIAILNISSKDSYIIDLKSFIAERSKFYVYMNYNELCSIMRIKNDINRIVLLRCFITVVGHMNVTRKMPPKYRGRICTISREVQANMCGKSLPTYRKHIKLLESENLVYIANNAKEGEKFNDCISRSCDRELCISYCREAGGEIHNVKEEVANERRKYKQIYNQLLKGNYNYSGEIVAAVKKYVDEINENGGDLDVRPFDYYKRQSQS